MRERTAKILHGYASKNPPTELILRTSTAVLNTNHEYDGMARQLLHHSADE